MQENSVDVSDSMSGYTENVKCRKGRQLLHIAGDSSLLGKRLQRQSPKKAQSLCVRNLSVFFERSLLLIPIQILNSSKSYGFKKVSRNSHASHWGVRQSVCLFECNNVTLTGRLFVIMHCLRCAPKSVDTFRYLLKSVKNKSRFTCRHLCEWVFIKQIQGALWGTKWVQRNKWWSIHPVFYKKKYELD